MVQPCENQKQDWPLSQESVPLVHRQLYGSIQPVFGCLPADHAGSVASMALRVGGMMRDAWPCTALVASSSIRFLIRSTDRHQAQMSRRGRLRAAARSAWAGARPSRSAAKNGLDRHGARCQLWPSHRAATLDSSSVWGRDRMCVSFQETLCEYEDFERIG